MRGGSLLAVVCVLALAATSLPVSGWHPVHVPHQPVAFNSNSDFGTRLGGFCVPNVANGVVGGCGTESNPWRIEGWLFVAIPGAANVLGFSIRIKETTDHVLIQDNHFLRHAVHVRGAENVHIEANQMELANAIVVDDGGGTQSHSKNIDIIGNTINVQAEATAIWFSGVFEDIQNIHIEGNTITESSRAIFMERVRDVTITGNTISRNTEGIVCQPACPNIEIVNNLISDNVGAGITTKVLHLGITNGNILGNIIRDNGEGFTGKLCSSSPDRPAPRFSGNNIYGNTEWGVKITACGVDGRNNWWGDESGPSGDGGGSGDALIVDGGQFDWDPWLTSPNPDAGP